MNAKHEMDKVILMQDGHPVATLTPEEAMTLARELLDACGKIKIDDLGD